MGLRDDLTRVLAEYPHARRQPFAKNPLASFIRTDLPRALANFSTDPKRYKWAGSAGLGQWARAPWVAAFDVLVTNSAQEGYYPVYLFREDSTGVYLSLNQGVTTVKEQYKANAKTSLRTRAADFRSRLGEVTKNFPDLAIDLRPSAQTNDSAFYEAGNICSIFYPANSIPPEAELIRDFQEILRLYNLLSSGEAGSIGSGTDEEEERWESKPEDLEKFRFHKRIERNSQLAKDAKKALGSKCQACGFNFGAAYGVLGEGYIEAHHKTPLSTLKGGRLLLNPKTDFAVLCANCHRMIHRTDAPHDIEAFVAHHLKIRRGR